MRARDQNSPTTAHQTSFKSSPIIQLSADSQSTVSYVGFRQGQLSRSRRSRLFLRFATTIPISLLRSLAWSLFWQSQSTRTAMADIPDLLKRAFATRVSLPLKETASLLGIDQKTLRGHVKTGNIRFVVVGLGMTKLRREFTLSDILEFLERMRCRECPSISAPTRPTTTMISSGDVLGFTARRAKLIAERRKHSNVPKRSA
jgi:hypothetical protein